MLKALKSLEAKGVRLAICNTCLTFYAFDIVDGLSLILPGVTRIQTRLIPLAAACLALVTGIFKRKVLELTEKMILC
ncbi:MAG: hypothetical protein KAS36_08570 [Anaerolineales bacterium]|nr:hypothetical protein [Anaerolineales bacterium]